MKVYTHHPSTFRVDAPNLVIDPTKGIYWDCPAYRDALPKLQALVQTSQFLWCEFVSTFVRPSESIDLVGWEIEIPFNEILAFIHEDGGWKTLFEKSPSVDWSKLLVKPTEQEVTPTDQELESKRKDISCLIRVPVKNAKSFEMIPLDRQPDRKRWASRPKP